MGMIGRFYLVDDAQIKNLDNLEDEDLDIDKSWDILFAMFEDELYIPLDDELYVDGISEFGAFLVLNSEVDEKNITLSKITKSDFEQRFDLDKLAKTKAAQMFNIYIPSVDEKDEFFKYAYSYFCEIQKLYQKAVDEKKNILFTIN